MIDHVSIALRYLAAAADFYEAVLGALGFVKLDGRAAMVGFGKRYSEFWINQRPALSAAAPDSGAHVALRAPNGAAVDAFHAPHWRPAAPAMGRPDCGRST